MWGRGWLGCVALLLTACSAPGPVASSEPPTRLGLLHTADLHSRVWPFEQRLSAFDASLGLGRVGALAELGGFARLASMVRRERALGAELWLDSGDAVEGAPVFERFGGRVELELLGGL